MIFVEETLTTMGIYIILATAFDLIIGYAGLFSIAQAAFYAIGAYGAADLSLRGGLPIVLAWIAAGLISAVVSLGLAAVAMRVSDDYLVIASFGFLTVTLAIFSNTSLGGGLLGISGVPNLGLFGFTVDTSLEYAITYVGIAAIVSGILYWVGRSPYGRSLKAGKADRLGAESIGKPTLRLRFWAFGLSAAITAVAGAMYGSYVSFVSPDAFGNTTNVLIFAMVFIGGSGTILGPLVGAILLVWIPALVSLVSFSPALLGNLEQAIYGVILIAVVIGAPSGLSGLVGRFGREGEPGPKRHGLLSHPGVSGGPRARVRSTRTDLGPAAPR